MTERRAPYHTNPHTPTELVQISRDYLTMAREAMKERNPDLADACVELADAYLENVQRRLEREGEDGA